MDAQHPGRRPPLLRVGLARDPRAQRHIGTFLAAALVTVLVTRGLLALTGYPQLGGSGLHIAHVLWGGLLMALSFVLLLSFVGPAVRPLAALVGGVGLGLFVDEIGKFVTDDNDYFYEPTAALVYGALVGLALVADTVHSRRAPHRTEALAAAVDQATAGVAGGMTPRARRRAHEALEDAGDVRGAAETRALLGVLEEDHDELPDPVGALSRVVDRTLRRLVRARAVPAFAVAVFAVAALVTVTRGVLAWRERADEPGWVVGGMIVSGLVSFALCAVGLVRSRTDRVDGYRWFRRAVLLSLSVTQVFLFRISQWDATLGLAVDLLVLGLVAAELDVLRAGGQREAPAPEAPAPGSEAPAASVPLRRTGENHRAGTTGGRRRS
ncbi:hypothetical protein [Cellulomonas marina]|uniref:Uncharacterized protein n=1 Tax=Cellulomonas marina TaxID=988821 RepID=A0A1I0X6Z7_9CELL|nr:hypothetical protein [Cellulomonas marina]GIG28978.1 hypothetical protein Cma02nite_15780 [Cellulomonas marina]SFA96437.1 hypothetical protein SAMN05421867_104156 [Cellulomonas marina]